MDPDTEQSIRKALEAQRIKNQELQERIRITEEETKKYVNFI